MLAGATLGGPARGQESSGSGSGSGTGSSGGSRAPGSSGSGNAPASADEGATSAFGAPSGGTPAPAEAPTPPPSQTIPGTEPAPRAGAGASPGGEAPPSEPATTFTLPGNFGRPSESFTVGQGRLARPRFRFTGAFAVGFDDNIFGTPTKQQEFPARTVVVRPEQIVQVRDPSRDQVVFNGPIRTVIPGFREERLPELTQEIPGGRTEPRQSSIVARTNVGMEIQFASRRTLFTLDSRLGAEYTAARDREPTQYFGSLGLRFVHKLAPRLQWNASIDGTYTQQPDFSRSNTPTNVTAGSYLNLIARTGLEYRWTPRLTTAASVAYQTLTYSDSSEQGGDFSGFTYSLEGRYLISPRLTVLGEARFASTSYANDFARDSTTAFYLAGANWIITNRLNSSARAGFAIRGSESGGNSVSPYLELNIGYRLSRGSLLQWNTQYGFEEPGDSNSEVVTFRNGLSYIQYFTPRLRAVAGGNLLYSTTTNKLTDDSITQVAFDLNLGLEYNINRRWTFTSTYSFTTVFSDNEFADYYRNRLFLGFQFAF